MALSSSSQPAISVVVPVYNVEAWLEQCLDSILQQTWEDLEVLCIDDGSTDRSAAMLDAFAARDARVRVVHKENGGYGKAVNLGISLARGAYLGIVEPDDFLDGRMYEKLYAAAVENDADVTKATFYWYWNEQDFYVANEDSPLFNREGSLVSFPAREGLFELEPSIWSGLYRLSWLREHHITCQETPGASYQDTGFYLKTCSLSRKTCLLAEALYYYRQSNADASTKHWGQKYNYLFQEMEHVWDTLPTLRESPPLASAFLKRAYSVMLAGVIHAPSAEFYPCLKRVSADLKKWTAEGSYEASAFDPERLSSLLLLRRSPVLFFMNRLWDRFKKRLPRAR